ncbi:polyprotein [Glycine max]|nr:polyprotein [Glycine max]
MTIEGFTGIRTDGIRGNGIPTQHPLQWVIGYEKLRENTKPFSTSQATFRRSIDGLVTTTFKKSDEASSSNSSEVFHSLMIKPKVEEDSRMPIFAVKADGRVIYSDKVNGHFIWDVAPEMCDSDCSYDDHDGDTDDEDEGEGGWKPEPRPYKRSPPPQRRSDPKNGPWTGIKKKYPEDPFWKEKRMAEILGWNHPSLKIPEAPIPCMMFSSTSYDQKFPSLDKKTDPVTKVSTKPYIIPTEVGPEGKLKSPSQVEEVLNWQTNNARAQNLLLKKIDEKIDKIYTHVNTNDERLQYLSERMKKHYHQISKEISRLEEEWRKTTFGAVSDAKEREIRRLKAQVQDLDRYIESKMIEKQKFNPPDYFFPKASLSWSLPTTSAYKKKSEPPKREPTKLNISSQESAKSPTKLGDTLKKDPHEFQDSHDPYSQLLIREKLEISEESDETGIEFDEFKEEFEESSIEAEKVFPPWLVTHTHAQILEYAKSHYFHFLHKTLRFKYTPAQIFDPKIPFGGIFELFCEIGWDLCEPTIWAIWCNTVQYSIFVALKPLMTYYILTDPYKDEYLLWTMLEWFSPLAWWRMKLKQILDIERQRGIPEDYIGNLNTNDGQIQTEIYVPDPEFQKVEDLADDDAALEQDLEHYNAQLMEELLHKKRYPYHHAVYESLTRSKVQHNNLSLSTRSD